MSSKQDTNSETRTFVHLGLRRPISHPEYTDEQVAHGVRMLSRHQMNHEDVVCTARDRILCLVEEKKLLQEKYDKLCKSMGLDKNDGKVFNG